MTTPEEVLEFWFDELQPKDWWRKSDSLDRKIGERFTTTHLSAIRGELHRWREKPLGSLAEIIVLDQFSRNIYRDSAQAFSQDPQALTLSQVAVARGFDKELSVTQRQFLYMPYMHSESVEVHELAVPLFKSLGADNGYDFELKHKEIIDLFGRYPHRNNIVGRESTDEEIEFLKQPGSSF